MQIALICSLCKLMLYRKDRKTCDCKLQSFEPGLLIGILIMQLQTAIFRTYANANMRPKPAPSDSVCFYPFTSD